MLNKRSFDSKNDKEKRTRLEIGLDNMERLYQKDCTLTFPPTLFFLVVMPP